VIDHFFALPDLPSIIEQLRAVSIGDSHQWALDTADLLETRSPLAMAVTLELLRRGRHLALEDCFAMELHMDRQWFEHGDIIEGVRALIIDKDKQPRWNPPTLAALNASGSTNSSKACEAGSTQMQDLELSEEQIMIRDMARDFARGEIAPTPRPGKRPAGSMTRWCARWANWACWAWWCRRSSAAATPTTSPMPWPWRKSRPVTAPPGR
jgi:hypothetical protein